MRTTRLWIGPMIGGVYILVGPTLWLLHWLYPRVNFSTEHPACDLPFHVVVLFAGFSYIVGTIAHDFLRFCLKGSLYRPKRVCSFRPDNWTLLLLSGKADAIASVRGTYDTQVLFRLLTLGTVVHCITIPVLMCAKGVSPWFALLTSVLLSVFAVFLFVMERGLDRYRTKHLVDLIRAMKPTPTQTV